MTLKTIKKLVRDQLHRLYVQREWGVLSESEYCLLKKFAEKLLEEIDDLGEENG